MTQLNHQARPRLVPRRRFPEFRDAPGWERKDLGQIVDFQSGGTPSKNIPAYWEGSIPWVSAKDMKRLFLDDTEDHITIRALGDGAIEVPAGTVLMLTRGMTLFNDLPISVSRRSMSFNQDVKALRIKRYIDPDFLPYLLLGNKRRLLRMVDSAGHGTGRLETEKLKTFQVMHPQACEQQRIAACLNSLDEVIGAEGQTLAALKTHRLGLMQQLFPREGETMPRLRFPEFQRDSAWESKKAGHLFDQRIEQGEADLPIYSVTIDSGMVERSSLDRRVNDIADPRANKRAHEDDITYNMMRAWQGALGVAAEDCMVSPAYVVVAPREGVCSAFYEYLLKLPKSLAQLTAHSQGLTKDRLRLYYKDFATIPLPHPKLAEQQQIASCISTVDDLIATRTEKIERLRGQRQGLMQQLFPAIADADG